MPERHAGESHDDFVSRCIPIVIEDGTAKDQDQAVAICNSMWESAEMSKATQFTLFAAGYVGVDRNNRIIRGMVIMEAGPLKDGRYAVDATTLKQLVELGNRGVIKSHLSHAHAHGFQDGITSRLGEFVNFRMDGNKVRADLRLYEAASKGPAGDLAEYVMLLAEEAGETFGVSVVITAKDGENIDGKARLRIIDFSAADLVGEPAATSAAFSEQPDNEGDTMSAEALEALQKKVESLSGLPETIELLSAQLKEIKDKPAPQPLSDDPEISLLVMKQYQEEFGPRGLEWGIEGRPERECFQLFIKQLREENDSLRQKLADRDAKIEFFKRQTTEDILGAFAEKQAEADEEENNPHQYYVPGTYGPQAARN